MRWQNAYDKEEVMLNGFDGITIIETTDFDLDYKQDLAACKDYGDLLTLASNWGRLFPDMALAVVTMQLGEASLFLKARDNMELQALLNKDEPYQGNPILLPQLLLRVHLIAKQFDVPAGTALMQLIRGDILGRNKFTKCFEWLPQQKTDPRWIDETLMFIGGQ